MRLYLKISLLLLSFWFISCQKSPSIDGLQGTFWTHERESTNIASSIAVIHFKDDATMIFGVGNPEDNTAWGFPLSYVVTGKDTFRFGFSLHLENDEDSPVLREELNIISGTGAVKNNTLTLTFKEDDAEVYTLNSNPFTFSIFGDDE